MRRLLLTCKGELGLLSESTNKLGFEKKTKPGKRDLKGPVGKAEVENRKPPNF